MRKSPRDRRLEADHRAVIQLSQRSTIFSFDATGNPPQRYRLKFQGPGLVRSETGHIVARYQHHVIVELGAAYPRMVPNLGWQTPIFHPNISNNGVVCLGGYGTHWVPSLTLDELSGMLWDMIRYKNFDTDSPYNREAAIWAKMQTAYAFPLDHRSIRDRAAEAVIAEQPPKETANQPMIIETGIEIVERREPDGSGIIFLD
jgi:ubiquitin-protein ligase